MKIPRALQIVHLVLTIGLTFACAKQTGLPGDNSDNRGVSQKVPFDRESAGIPPASLVTAVVSKLPEGTPITIRLLNAVSSASSNAGDRVECLLDDPIVIDGQTAVPRGAAAIARVLAAKASGRPHSPGYLRIALVSLQVDGKPVGIETSSLFVKGGSHEKLSGALAGGGTGSGPPLAGPGRGSKGALMGASGSAGGVAPTSATGKKEVSFGTERRLTFRLAQAVELQ